MFVTYFSAVSISWKIKNRNSRTFHDVFSKKCHDFFKNSSKSKIEKFLQFISKKIFIFIFNENHKNVTMVNSRIFCDFPENGHSDNDYFREKF